MYDIKKIYFPEPTLPVLAATQRVQQKAAIAIGRLAVYHGLCLSLVSGGGLERLVELAVCRAARLDSDYTLVSVVTAVRKIGITMDIRNVEIIDCLSWSLPLNLLSNQ